MSWGTSGTQQSLSLSQSMDNPASKVPQNDIALKMNDSGKSTPVMSNLHEEVPKKDETKEQEHIENKDANPSNMSRLMNDLQRTQREKKEALEQVNKLKSLLGSSSMNTQHQSSEQPKLNQGQAGLLDDFKEMVATQGESAAVAWISKQLEASDNHNNRPTGMIHTSQDLLLSSVIPPLTPRSRPGSRAASPERGGGGGLLVSQSLGQNLNQDLSQGRGRRMMTPLPRQLKTGGNSGGHERGIASGGSGVQSFQGSSSIEHEYLVAAAKSIPNEYGTQLASYLVRRPYIDLEGDGVTYSYAHFTDKNGYLQNGTAFDPNSLEIVAYIEADGSVFTLTGRSNARHGKQSGNNAANPNVDWAIFDHVEEMDRALGKVTYIDVEGNEREYWLDSIYEEALTTRESYCMSMISAAFALKEVTGSMSGGRTSFQNVGGANNTHVMQQPPMQQLNTASPLEFMQSSSQNNGSANNKDGSMQHDQQPPPMQTFQPSNQMMQDGNNNNMTPPMNEGNIAQQSMPTSMPNAQPEYRDPSQQPAAQYQQPPSKEKQSQPQSDTKQATAKKTMPPKEEEYEPADSALPHMVIYLFSLLFSFLWFFIKIPFTIGSTIFTFWVVVVALRLFWLFFADDNGAWEMGAGVEYEYNMPGIY